MPTLVTLPKFTGTFTLQPEGRSAAVNATLKQTFALPGAEYCTCDDLLAAWKVLATPKDIDGDDKAIAARRQTLAELRNAAYAAGFGSGSSLGSVAEATHYFEAIVAAYATSEDPRQKAMAATAARELSELKDYIDTMKLS